MGALGWLWPGWSFELKSFLSLGWYQKGENTIVDLRFTILDSLRIMSNHRNLRYEIMQD